MPSGGGGGTGVVAGTKYYALPITAATSCHIPREALARKNHTRLLTRRARSVNKSIPFCVKGRSSRDFYLAFDWKTSGRGQEALLLHVVAAGLSVCTHHLLLHSPG